jgi:phage gp45-like
MEDLYTTRNTAHHFVVDSVDDSGTEQYRNVTGLEGEAFTQVLHIQSHGFTSNSPKDAHMIGLSLGNMRDALFLFGGEHPDYKPKNVASGDCAMYNQAGSLLQMIGLNPVMKADSFTLTLPKGFKVVCGGVTYAFGPNGLDVTGGYVKHNGHAIDDTHQHKDTQPGSGQSGVPE